MKKQEAKAPAPVLAPDTSGQSQVQPDPTRKGLDTVVEEKAKNFRQRLKDIRDKLKMGSSGPDEI